MKPMHIIVILVVAVCLFFLFGGNKKKQETAHAPNHSVLIAYFSLAGEQQEVGTITEGNTAKVAKIIANKTGGDLFEIKVDDGHYPKNLEELKAFAERERNEQARPQIQGPLPDIEQYSIIFIGYPNWFDDVPMPIYSFTENYDFGEDRQVFHFCTHEGSGCFVPDSIDVLGHVAQKDPVETDKIVSRWIKDHPYF